LTNKNRVIELETEFFWEKKADIFYDSTKESFYDYLIKEKEKYDQFRPLNKLAPIIGGLILLLFSAFLSIIGLIDSVITFFIEGTHIGPSQFQSDFFSLLLLTSMIASILGQILVIFMLIFKSFFTKSNWSKFHDQTLLLTERLAINGFLDEYIQFTKDGEGKNKFKLSKISVDFQIEWVFPFIFTDFPPLLFEITILSFLFPFSIATLVSFFVAFFTSDWITSGAMIIVFALIIAGTISTSTAIYRSWSNYSQIRTKMIDYQYAIIHNLTLQGANDLTIIRNENNLTRLQKMHPFPLPSIFRITTFIPLIGSLLGYVVGLAILL
jgi:hypothetical protein